MIRFSFSLLFALILFCINAQDNTNLLKDSIQSIFKAGKIISLKGDFACYRLNGLHNSGSYGYCYYDRNYTPKFSNESTGWEKEKGVIDAYINSNCYTIIAPVFDYAQPFSEGWGAVCKNKKWSYVSSDGRLMCDYVLDAAYPFNNGKAKVIYKGESFEIDLSGNGLPKEINQDTQDMNRELRLETIKQLYEEKQHEKAIEFGNALYKEITDYSRAPKDATVDELTYALQAESLALSSQNSLMAQLVIHFPDLFDYYQSIDLDRRFSSESGHYELNSYNSKSFFLLFKQKYSSDTLVTQIINDTEGLDYQSAILLFEDWLDNKTILLDESPLELMVYYYLAELSNDFERGNYLLLSISKLYENHGFDWIKDDYITGSILLNIKRYQSAKNRLEQAVKQSKKDKNVLKLAVCYYNLGLLYETAKDIDHCQYYYQSAINTLQNSKPSIMEVELENGIMSDYFHFILRNNLWNNSHNSLWDEYIQSEISYNSNVFIETDILHTNRIWGRSMNRMQKVLQHLDNCRNNNFLKGALTLSIFQQSIASDAEHAFLRGLKNTHNNNIKHLTEEYMQLKNGFKGFDLFDLSELNSNNKANALKISSLESEIRELMINEGSLHLDIHYLNPLHNIKNNDVVIDVVEYSIKSKITKKGVFLYQGGDSIKFIPLSKQFSPENFWPIISNAINIDNHDTYYLYSGILDQYGLEYEDTGDGVAAYFKYNIHRVNTLADLNHFNQPSELKSIALFGGLDYGEELIARNRGAIESGYLEYSITEIEAISQILDEKMNVSIFTEKEGTIDRFLCSDVLSANIIHLATHGYHNNESKQWDFNRDRFNYYQQNTDVENMEWLMNNTGIYFSISDKDSVNILSSREVASCDLSNTSLVVLSACSTLAGEVSSSYSSTISLTMAFAISQAQNIITSLYDVDDKKAYEFMIYFYKELVKTYDIYDSFKKAVAAMKSKYPNKKEIWGAFVLLENH